MYMFSCVELGLLLLAKEMDDHAGFLGGCDSGPLQANLKTAQKSKR